MKANLLAAAAIAIVTTALGACVGPGAAPQGAAVLPPRPATAWTPPAPAVPRGTSWQDIPATSGTWEWSAGGSTSVARFAGGRLSLRCDAAGRTVRIERSEPATTGSATAVMTIVTQTQTRAFNATAQSGVVSVALQSRDPLLDAMAFSRGRFAVEVTGWPTLYVPSWTEVSRVIEDCR